MADRLRNRRILVLTLSRHVHPETDTDVRLGQGHESDVAFALEDGRADRPASCRVGDQRDLILPRRGVRPPRCAHSSERATPFDAFHRRRVEALHHVEGDQVLAHLLDAARAGDHRRHVRVLRAPRERELRERAAEVVGDRLEPRAPCRWSSRWSATAAATRSPGSAPRLSSGMPSRYLPVSTPDASGLQIVSPSPMSS